MISLIRGAQNRVTYVLRSLKETSVFCYWSKLLREMIRPGHRGQLFSFGEELALLSIGETRNWFGKQATRNPLRDRASSSMCRFGGATPIVLAIVDCAGQMLVYSFLSMVTLKLVVLGIIPRPRPALRLSKSPTLSECKVKLSVHVGEHCRKSG